MTRFNGHRGHQRGSNNSSSSSSSSSSFRRTVHVEAPRGRVHDGERARSAQSLHGRLSRRDSCEIRVVGLSIGTRPLHTGRVKRSVGGHSPRPRSDDSAARSDDMKCKLEAADLPGTAAQPTVALGLVRDPRGWPVYSQPYKAAALASPGTLVVSSRDEVYTAGVPSGSTAALATVEAQEAPAAAAMEQHWCALWGIPSWNAPEGGPWRLHLPWASWADVELAQRLHRQKSAEKHKRASAEQPQVAAAGVPARVHFATQPDLQPGVPPSESAKARVKVNLEAVSNPAVAQGLVRDSRGWPVYRFEPPCRQAT